MTKWEKVVWSSEEEFVSLVMKDDVYVNDGGVAHTVFSSLLIEICDSIIGITVPELYSQGHGFIKKEVDWADVISHKNPMILISKEDGNLMIARGHGTQSFSLRIRPATLEEVKKHIWECMK